jgi:hypothetical protein
MLEAVIDNKNGTLWDISSVCSSITWKTTLFGKAGSVDIDFIPDSPFQAKKFTYSNGDVLRLRLDGNDLFLGFIFENEASFKQPTSIMAYDQLRYLTEADTYVRTNIRADQIVKENAVAANLKIGSLADTVHSIPKVYADGLKRFDIIGQALDDTMQAKSTLFVLYDDYGSLVLRNVTDMVMEFVLGDNSLLTNYKYKKSIDTDTYNIVKFVYDNKKTKKRDVYIAKDSASIARWGQLQLFRKLPDDFNLAQVNDLVMNWLKLKNREQETLTVEAIGQYGIRAGVLLMTVIEEIGIKGFFLVKECTHKFRGNEHTMSLELRVIDFV